MSNLRSASDSGKIIAFNSDIDLDMRGRGKKRRRPSDHELAGMLADEFNVEDPDDAVLEFGPSRTWKIFRRLIRRKNAGLMDQVANKGGYFIAALNSERMKKRNSGSSSPNQDDTERSDDFYENYLERQRARGAQ